MQASARARLFVLFLDTYHVEIAGSHNIRRPLVDALDRVIGPDDLVGVMTPDMSPTDITFARKTTTIDGILHAPGVSAIRSRIQSRKTRNTAPVTQTTRSDVPIRMASRPR
jgi:hypothetical protein